MSFTNLLMKRSLSQKVWLSIGILLIAYCSTSIQAFLSKGKIQKKLNTIGISSEKLTVEGQNLQSHVQAQIQLYQDAVMMNEKSMIDEASSHSQSARKAIEELTKLPHNSPDTIEKLKATEKAVAEFTNEAEPVYTRLADGDDSDETVNQVGALAQQYKQIQKNVMEVTGMVTKDITTALTHMGVSIEQAKWIELITFLASFIASIVVITFVLHIFVAKPIHSTAGELNEIAVHVTSVSQHVYKAGQDIATSASNQASSITETSSSLEEMASMTKQNADHANHADILMKESVKIVSRANQSMSRLTASMEETAKVSQETQKIIKTIDEIAFQTNLLALNAAVEAARAGEAGAGFAVVAEEVRNLAMRSADAAKNTAELIQGTVKNIREGSDMVRKTNEDFTQVSSGTKKVGELVGEIAVASNEQAQGIDQANKAVAEMDKLIQDNAASSEESASAYQEMSTYAEKMKDMVNNLMALVKGDLKRSAFTETQKGQSREKTDETVFQVS